VTARGALAGLVLASALAGCYDFEQFAPINQSWRLVPSESSIHFIGIKNDSVAVPGSFTTLDGFIDGPKHSAMVEVKLGSTDTGNPARDENIRAQFFEVAKFPLARFEVAKLPDVGSMNDEGVELSGVLSLHGASIPLKIPARAKYDGGHRIRVRNAAPFVLSAHDLGMDGQLAALKAVCGHESLSGAIPVEFDVVFALVGPD
jgi:polyisoprenoid-binding protein YceI